MLPFHNAIFNSTQLAIQSSEFTRNMLLHNFYWKLQNWQYHREMVLRNNTKAEKVSFIEDTFSR
jgi:hypothetical protein